MSTRDMKQLDEFKASGENSVANDPMTPAGGSDKKRPADKSTGDTGYKTTSVATPGQGGTPTDQIENVPTVKTATRRADQSMGEAVGEIFAGADLSEEFKEKATVIFEAAVHAKISEELERLEEEYAAKLDEQVETLVTDLVEKVDSYLDYVVEQWMQENQVAIDRGIRAEIAESFIDGLRNLFVEHNINIPEEETDIIADMAEELDVTESALNESINETIELRKQIEAYKAKEILESYTKGLTETQAEKLRTLSEGVEFGDSKEFERKVQIIKEQYFGGKSVLSESKDQIDPVDLNESAENVNVDASVAYYAQALSKTLRKS